MGCRIFNWCQLSSESPAPHTNLLLLVLSLCIGLRSRKGAFRQSYCPFSGQQVSACHGHQFMESIVSEWEWIRACICPTSARPGWAWQKKQERTDRKGWVIHQVDSRERRISIHTQIVLNAERLRLRFRAVVEPVITLFRCLYLHCYSLCCYKGGQLFDHGLLSFEAIHKWHKSKGEENPK